MRASPGTVGGMFPLCLLVAMGCAGAPHEGARPPSDAGTRDPGQQCLLDAKAARTPPSDAPARIVVAHILVRHAELDRPQGASRNPKEACLRALSSLKELQQGGTWQDVATRYSDAQTTDLGEVSPDQLDPAFANAAFSLEAQELSYVVETSRGFHVILRER